MRLAEAMICEPAPDCDRDSTIRISGFWDFLYLEYDLKDHLVTFDPVPGTFGILSVHFPSEEWRLLDADRGSDWNPRWRFDNSSFKKKRLSHVLGLNVKNCIPQGMQFFIMRQTDSWKRAPPGNTLKRVVGIRRVETVRVQNVGQVFDTG